MITPSDDQWAAVKAITRADAILAGEKLYRSARPCPRGHTSPRRVGNRACCACEIERSAAYQKAHPERVAAWNARARTVHADSIRVRNRNYLRANPEKAKAWREASIAKDPDLHRRRSAAHSKAWAIRNPEKHKAANARWRAFNGDRLVANCVRRRAAQRRATLAGVPRESFLIFYREARRLTRETGIRHVVDHEVPLQGKTVCGLHVPWNLRVITRDENARKHARLLPEFSG